MNKAREKLVVNEIEFLGEDGRIYMFDVKTFDYLCREFRQSDVIECIQGDLKDMITTDICRLSNLRYMCSF